MHGETGQYGDRPTVPSLEGDQRQIGIFRPGLARHIVPVAAGVHVSADGRVAERVIDDAVGTANPAAQRRVLGRIGNRPTGASRLELSFG